MPRIFVSYRRDDTAGIAGRIYDRLVSHYGPDAIFFDIDSIPLGINFREHIAQILPPCDVALFIVGAQWLGPRRKGRPRIRELDDPVRMEVEAALQSNIEIIPILVDKAKMPPETEIPESTRRFCLLNAAQIDS